MTEECEVCFKKKRLNHMCESCGIKYCNQCAKDMDYQCDCHEPPRIVKIKVSKK